VGVTGLPFVGVKVGVANFFLGACKLWASQVWAVCGRLNRRGKLFLGQSIGIDENNGRHKVLRFVGVKVGVANFFLGSVKIFYLARKLWASQVCLSVKIFYLA